MEDSVARAAEHRLIRAVSKVAGIQGLGAVNAGEAGGVAEPGPGHHPLGQVGHGAAPYALLGAFHLPPLGRVQVEVFGDKVIFDEARLTKNLIFFVAKHSVVTQSVTALKFSKKVLKI